MSALIAFNEEKLMFKKECAKRYYSAPIYFAVRLVFDLIPLRIIPTVKSRNNSPLDGVEIAPLDTT